MKEYTKQHKKAWEYNAYEFWVKNAGTPAERAKEDTANPEKMLRKYAQYCSDSRSLRLLMASPLFSRTIGQSTIFKPV